MSTLIILNGPVASGKTTYARSQDLSWYVTGDFDDAISELNAGGDVILDCEYLTPHNVILKKFTHEEEEK